MALIHSLSSEAIKSELDIFALPPTQTSIECGSWLEYSPVSSIGSSDGPIEFNVGGSGQDYIDLSHSNIYVQAQIVRADGTPIDDTDNVGPVNLFLHSLFSEVDVKLNDTIVSSTNNTYAYRAYIESLLSYGPAAKKSQLTSALYFKDVRNSMEEANPHDQNALNLGFVKRHSFFEGGRVVDMIGRLHSDLFFQDKYLPSDVNIRIRLVRNKDSFCLMSNVAQAAFKIKILECKLLVRKVKLSPSIFVAHAKALEHGNAKYAVRRVVVKTFTIPRGSLSNSAENLFSGQLPTRIVFGCVDNDSFNGSYLKNPFNFKHFNQSQIKLYLDGQNRQITPIETNFAARQYISAYMSLFSGVGSVNDDIGNHIDREDFAGGYALYAFDLTPDLSESGHFNLIREGNLRVDLKFTLPLANTINVIAYAEFQNIIEFDRNKNILFDYNN
jgi:hypothetical protein